MVKIMLVEDDAVMGSLLTTLLELDGYEVHTIKGTGEQDIFSQIQEISPQALLMDVHIRQTNGLNILRLLRNDEKIRATKVLMYSGMALKEECIRSGADGFLLKPFMPDELTSWLRANL